MKKLAFLLAQFIILFFLSGCWDYVEYENIAMISATGVDFNPESKEITVTLQYLVPGSKSSVSKEDKSKTSSSMGKVLSATDITMVDALAKIQQCIGKNLFYGYEQVIVVSESAAKNIMGDIIGFLDRTPEVRATTYLIVTSDKAEDVIGTFDPDITVPTGRNIHDLTKISNNTGNSFAISLNEFSKMLSIGGIEPVAPRVFTIIYDKPDKKEYEDITSKESQKSVKFIESKEGHHKVEGLAVFRGRNFAGWMDAKESKGWSWITGKSLKTYESTKSSGESDVTKIFYFRITKSRSKINAQMENGNPAVHIDIKAEADLRKSSIESDVFTPDIVNSMEKVLSDSIYSDVEAAIKKAQKELKSDIFGFGYSLYKDNPKLWHSTYEKKWEELFPDIPVSINVDAKVIGTGTSIRRFIFK